MVSIIARKQPQKQKNNKKKTNQPQKGVIGQATMTVEEIEEALIIIQESVEEMRTQGVRGALISQEVREKKTRDPFRLLVGCIISLRTKDEVTGPAIDRLFAKASSPGAMAELSPEVIAKAIYPAGFYNNKAKQIKTIAQQIMSEGGVVPDTIDELLKFKGVGRKTANLVVTLGFQKPGICVDTHVARITQRLGFVPPKTVTDEGEVLFSSPDNVEIVLRSKLPEKWWIPINDLLVSWGQEICKPTSPHCSRCPVKLCQKVGVTKSR